MADKVCKESPDGEHYGIDGKLVRFSFFEDTGRVVGHYIGECEHCGCEMHFTIDYIEADSFNGDTLEAEHFEGAQEFVLDE